MSDIRFNSWYHQSGTGGVHQDGFGNIGIGTTVPNATLEIVGDINTTGIITATGFSGDGSSLTGIQGVPAGSMIYSFASSPPSGFLKANGASVSTTTYAALFAAIGYTYGGSGGSFNLPDLRGEFIRAWDDGRGIDSGRSFGSSQAQSTQNLDGTTSLLTVYGGNIQYQFTNTDVDTNVTETRPRNIALLACIKY